MPGTFMPGTSGEPAGKNIKDQRTSAVIGISSHHRHGRMPVFHAIHSLTPFLPLEIFTSGSRNFPGSSSGFVLPSDLSQIFFPHKEPEYARLMRSFTDGVHIAGSALLPILRLISVN
jgi:hypothetical protein